MPEGAPFISVVRQSKRRSSAAAPVASRPRQHGIDCLCAPACPACLQALPRRRWRLLGPRSSRVVAVAASRLALGLLLLLLLPRWPWRPLQMPLRPLLPPAAAAAAAATRRRRTTMTAAAAMPTVARAPTKLPTAAAATVMEAAAAAVAAAPRPIQTTMVAPLRRRAAQLPQPPPAATMTARCMCRAASTWAACLTVTLSSRCASAMGRSCAGRQMVW